MPYTLILENQAQLRTFLGPVLKNVGYDVHRVRRGHLAMRALRSAPVDILIMGFDVPTRQLIDMLREVKRSHPNTKIIVTSSYDRPLELADKLGADRTLREPFDEDETLAVIRALLKDNEQE